MAESEDCHLASGVPVLDEILQGGLLARWAYLVRGTTGTGKTTLGLQFLMQRAAGGEKVLHSQRVYVDAITQLRYLAPDPQHFRQQGFAFLRYLADNLLFLRYLEMDGELRKAIGVLKKRLSDFEKTMREIEITRHCFKVGKPLTGLRGILLGVPEGVNPPARDPTKPS